MTKKKMFFMGGEKMHDPRFFVGGVGASYIPTKEILETKINLIGKQINNFVKDIYNNISFFPKNTFNSIESYIFSELSVKYIIDLDSKWQGNINTFYCRDAKNLTHFYAKGLYFGGQYTLQNCSKLHKYSNGITEIAHRYFITGNPLLKKLYFNQLTKIDIVHLNESALFNLPSIERIYIANVNNITQRTINQSMIRRNINSFLFNRLNFGCKIYINEYLGVKDRNAYTSLKSMFNLGDTVTINGLTYTCVNTLLNKGDFIHDPINVAITGINLGNAIRSETRIGTYSKVVAVNSDGFIGLSCQAVGVAGNSIEVVFGAGNTGTSTVEWSPLRYGRDIHPCLIHAREVDGAEIIICGSPIAVNKPTALSYSDKTSNSVKLNFTTPTPNANGTDCFEVWVEDSTIYRKLFEYTEITASGQVLNLSEVVTDVGTIDGVKIKIRTMDGQMNYSDFSNEITIV